MHVWMRAGNWLNAIGGGDGRTSSVVSVDDSSKSGTETAREDVTDREITKARACRNQSCLVALLAP